MPPTRWTPAGFSEPDTQQAKAPQWRPPAFPHKHSSGRAPGPRSHAAAVCGRGHFSVTPARLWDQGLQLVTTKAARVRARARHGTPTEWTCPGALFLSIKGTKSWRQVWGPRPRLPTGLMSGTPRSVTPSAHRVLTWFLQNLRIRASPVLEDALKVNVLGCVNLAVERTPLG